MRVLICLKTTAETQKKIMTSPFISLDDVIDSASVCSQDTPIFFEIDVMIIYHHIDSKFKISVQ